MPKIRRSARTAGIAAALAAAALGPVLLLAPAAGADQGGRSVRLEDRCDPATFTAAGIDCVGDGDVTLQEFVEELPEGGHHHWRFSRTDTRVDHGQALRLRNAGGETHSFTEVQNFGQGIVPPLNVAVPEDGPAVPVSGSDLLFLPPGGTATVRPGPGTHLYECLIHPWMRATVHVR